MSETVAKTLLNFGPPDVASTANFCLLMDKCFEYREKIKSFLKTYSNINDERFDWLENEGLQIITYSLIECLKFLLQSGVPYVFSERFSQDDLENYFGKQRAIGCRRDNPTVRDVGYDDNNINS